MFDVPVSVMFSMPSWFVPAAENVTEEETRSVPVSEAQLNDHIADVIDGIGVVADAPGHGIGARAAIEGVVARVTSQNIRQGVTGRVDVRRPGQRDVLDARLVACRQPRRSRRH